MARIAHKASCSNPDEVNRVYEVFRIGESEARLIVPVCRTCDRAPRQDRILDTHSFRARAYATYLRSGHVPKGWLELHREVMGCTTQDQLAFFGMSYATLKKLEQTHPSRIQKVPLEFTLLGKWQLLCDDLRWKTVRRQFSMNIGDMMRITGAGMSTVQRWDKIGPPPDMRVFLNCFLWDPVLATEIVNREPVPEGPPAIVEVLNSVYYPDVEAPRKPQTECGDPCPAFWIQGDYCRIPVGVPHTVHKGAANLVYWRDGELCKPDGSPRI